MVALSVPTRRKKVQGEKFGELNLSLEITLSDSDECPHPRLFTIYYPPGIKSIDFFFPSVGEYRLDSQSTRKSFHKN